MTLIDPVVVSVLREFGEDAACAEIEGQYQRFMHLSTDHEAVAHFFVDHWSGPGAWDRHDAHSEGEVGDDRDAVGHGDARLVGRVAVPGAAHMIPMTHPQAVVDAVRRKPTDPARADAIAADACFSSPVGFRTARPLSGMLLSFATNRRLISVLPA